MPAESRHQQAPAWRTAALVYASLLADVAVFFHRPLFSAAYVFPWDFRGVQLPMTTFLTDQLHQGHFPLWNPFSYCGYPVFANIEACFFHPLILASAFLAAHTSADSLPMLLEWAVVLQVWVAGIAAYRLFRNFGTATIPAWTGAIMFQTGGYFASRAEHIGAMMAVAWMPLAWLAVFKLRERFRPAWLAALAAALGMSILGGFPQPTLAVFVSTAVLAVVLIAVRLARLRLLLSAACGCALGIALAAVQFLPTMQLTEHSVAKYRADWLGKGGGLHWESLVSLVAPDHYHIFDMRQFRGPGDPTFLYLYCSIAGLGLAIYGLTRWRNRYAMALGLMVLIGVLWMLGEHTPIWRLVYPILPEKVRLGIHPEYTYCIVSLGLAGLAAVGLETLRIANAARLAIGIVIAADLFLVGSGRPMNCASIREEPGVTRTAFDGSPALLHEIRRYADRDYPPARIDAVDGGTAWATSGPIMQVPTANGVSPMALEHIIQLRLLLHSGERWGWYYPIENLDSPALDLMNVKYLVAGQSGASRLRLLPQFRSLESLPLGLELFENLAAMPRFFLVNTVRPVSSDREATELVERRLISFRDTATVSQTVAGLSSAGTGGDGAVQVIDYRPDSLSLSVRTRQAAFLVLAENFYPGWRAWVDGVPVGIVRADIAFRGLVVPAGTHEVVMRFQPMILPASLAISLVTALFLWALALWPRTARRATASS
ncbi:MAG: YfhO family protein [Bryobacteraceae bacterium]